MMDILKAKTIKYTQENKEAKSLPQTGEESNKDMTLPLMALLALSSIIAFVCLENVKLINRLYI